jgi:hypothetical protein
VLLLLALALSCASSWASTKPAIKSNSRKPSAHIPCGSQAYVLEEAHGICVLAGMLVKFHAAQSMKSIASYDFIENNAMLPFLTLF